MILVVRFVMVFRLFYQTNYDEQPGRESLMYCFRIAAFFNIVLHR